MMPRQHRWPTIAVALILWMVSATAAFSHATLVSSQPADGAVLDRAPAMLALTFNEAVAPLVFKLLGPDGAPISIAPPADGGVSLRIPVKNLAHGTHVLSWRVVSADGHPVGGALLFSIGAPTANAFKIADGNPVRGALFVIARVLLFIGLFGGIGGSLFLTLYRRPIPGAAHAARLCTGIGLIALPMILALQALDSLGAPVVALLDAASWRVAFASSVASMALTALAGFILGLIALSGCVAPRLCAVLATLCAGAALAMTGHASSAPPQWLSRPAVFLHIAGLCVWLGSLWPLALALIRTPEPQAPLARFSRLIPLPLAILIAAGGVRAEAGAWFNRIVAGTTTDRRFDLRVLAFDGEPAEVAARYVAGTWLAQQTATVDADPFRWQQVQASLVLPPTTTYVLVEIYAFEDVQNDAEGTEFAGHYADDISLVLVRP